jgi:hypothetical protein
MQPFFVAPITVWPTSCCGYLACLSRRWFQSAADALTRQEEFNRLQNQAARHTSTPMSFSVWRTVRPPRRPKRRLRSQHFSGFS